ADDGHAAASGARAQLVPLPAEQELLGPDQGQLASVPGAEGGDRLRLAPGEASRPVRVPRRVPDAGGGRRGVALTLDGREPAVVVEPARVRQPERVELGGVLARR